MHHHCTRGGLNIAILIYKFSVDIQVLIDIHTHAIYIGGNTLQPCTVVLLVCVTTGYHSYRDYMRLVKEVKRC